MPTTDVLAKVPAGLYVLTASGELGVFDEQRQFQIDAELTNAFAEHNRQFLTGYLKDLQADDRRIAIFYESSEKYPWGQVTLSLEDTVLRDLYPAGGRASALTAFQKKSRHMSTYRGMELLLDYHRDSKPELPVYCPVLFNAHQTLGARASAFGREPRGDEGAIPVMDVLNLVDTIPFARRDTPAIRALVERLRQGTIRKEQRRDLQYSIQHGMQSGESGASGEEAFADIARDKRLDRRLSLPSVDARQLHVTDRIDSIERWLKIPNQTVKLEQLRSFAHFQKLDDSSLDVLTVRSLVYTAPARIRLLDIGLKDAWNMYLLEGALMLIPADGNTLRIDSGQEKASFPIAFLKPRIYSVETLTQVSFLWIHDLLLEAVRSEKPKPEGEEILRLRT